LASVEQQLSRPVPSALIAKGAHVVSASDSAGQVSGPPVLREEGGSAYTIPASRAEMLDAPLPGAWAVMVGGARSHPMVGGYLRHEGLRVIDALNVAGAAQVLATRRVAIAVVETTSAPATGAVTILAQAAKEAGYPTDILTLGGPDTKTVVAALQAGAAEAFPASIPDEELRLRLRRVLEGHAARLNVLSRLDYLEWLSGTDLLTTLLSRRSLNDELARQAALADRHGLALAVVMFDVDRFKDVNDRIGHGGGDAALREVATSLRAGTREGDAIGRWGGDEFLAILPHTTLVEAESLAERIRSARAETPLIHKGIRIPVMVSAGCAATPGSAEALLTRCDLALYDAKAAGRNQVRTRSA
jgi:diguanylate cyclase (GGDEF)-like protein